VWGRWFGFVAARRHDDAAADFAERFAIRIPRSERALDFSGDPEIAGLMKRLGELGSPLALPIAETRGPGRDAAEADDGREGVGAGAHGGGTGAIDPSSASSPAGTSAEGLVTRERMRDRVREGREFERGRVAAALDHAEAVLRDGEVDLDDVTTPEKARVAQLELIAHLRDQLCDVLEQGPCTTSAAAEQHGTDRKEG
jgi:hypothetical protein